MPTVYVTSPPDAAQGIATTLVEDGLAACVNMVECHSVYRWDGEVHEDEEVILFVKTTEDRYEKVRERILGVHPHDVPCIERYDESDSLGAFEEWKESVTGSAG